MRSDRRDKETGQGSRMPWAGLKSQQEHDSYAWHRRVGKRDSISIHCQKGDQVSERTPAPSGSSSCSTEVDPGLSGPNGSFPDEQCNEGSAPHFGSSYGQKILLLHTPLAAISLSP